MSWKLIRSGESIGNSLVFYQEWQIDSVSDISSPPPETQFSAPSSKAWTGDYAHIYNKQNDGTWVDIMDEG